MRSWQTLLCAAITALLVPAAALAAPNLSLGSQGPSVALLQQELRDVGQSAIGSPDGVFGPITLAAVEQVQSQDGLATDGIVGPQTDQAIVNQLSADYTAVAGTLGAITLQPKDYGPPVAAMQTMLQQAGFNPGPADSVFNQSTERALLAFQAQQQLPASGVLDAATLLALRKATVNQGPVMIDGRVVLKVIHMIATAYDASYAQNGPWGAVAAYHALPLQPGIVAVDPSVIALGTRVYVSGYTDANLPSGGFLGLAADTGSAIIGRRIDIFMADSASVVSQFGFEPVTVDVLGPKS